jgi:hypothetical protein
MASHRAQLLLTLLPIALAFGMQHVEPEIKPLKVRSEIFCMMGGTTKVVCSLQNLDTDMPIGSPDTDAHFFVANEEHPQKMSREEVLDVLVTKWDRFDSRQLVPDTQWAEELTQYLEDLAEMRSDHVRAWVKSNLTRFQGGHTSVMELQQTVESTVIDLKSGVQLCRMECTSCQLFCLQSRFHEGSHDCKTMHSCTQSCDYCAEASKLNEEGGEKNCSMT